MDKVNYRITLDVQKGGVQKKLSGFFTGDVMSRRIAIGLAAGTVSCKLEGENITALMYVTKPNGVTNYGACEIVNNTVYYDVIQADTDVEGIVEMQLKVISEDMVLYAPRFALEVQQGNTDTVAEESPQFTALEEALLKAEAGKIVPCGEWDANTTYLELHYVSHNGSSYVALKPSVGKVPENGEFWMEMNGAIDFKLIADGSIPAGDSVKLGGKGASYYASADELNVERERITNLAKLEEGSTTGDAELADIRVGADGETYANAGEAVRGQIGELKETMDNFYNISESGNFYNDSTKLEGKDINSSTGALIDDARYNVSDKIVMDFTRQIIVVGSSYKYAYCYDTNDVYLGRYDTGDTTDSAKDKYPNTEYIRFVAKQTDTNIMVVYYEYRNIPYTPYNPIGGWVGDTPHDTPQNVRVVTYNMGNFSGEGLERNTEECAIAYRKAIGKCKGNINCYQYDTWINGQNPKDYIYANARNAVSNGASDYNFHGVSSDFAILSNGANEFSNNGNLTHKIYQYVLIEVNGKTVLVVNLHFEWQDNTQRAGQITDVLSFVKDYDNVIVCGDFNPEDYIDGVRQSSDLTYKADLNRFTDAGFKCANGVGYFGAINTIAEKGYVSGPFDNILVKGAMAIKDIGIIEEQYMNDHYPFYADITIY